MKNEQNGLNLGMLIIAVILGVAVFKQFDFETFRFKKVGLGIVYLVTFVAAVTFLWRSRSSKR